MLCVTTCRMQVEEEAANWRQVAACKADLSDVHRLLEDKASIVHVKEALRQKADRRVVSMQQDTQQQCTDMVDKIDRLDKELQQKAESRVRIGNPGRSSRLFVSHGAMPMPLWTHGH